MPERSRFDSEEKYYYTLFHELIHSTGPALQRVMNPDKSTKAYAFEELVAEIGASYLAKHAHLVVDPQSTASYLQSWFSAKEWEKLLRGDKTLWAREHYKSTVITFAGIIQEILKDPEITIGIFSFNKPTARKFLRQIKYELESNRTLQALYPDVLWADPKKESPRWSEDSGIVVKRKGNAKEATVEGNGLVDGQPTGAHYLLRVYDDVVTVDSVTSPEMIQKTTEAWSLSDNLGARGDSGMARAWHIGTRYHFGDTYQTMMDMGAVIPRIYPATDTGYRDGDPVFLPKDVWDDKKKRQTTTVLAAQMLQNPSAGTAAIFDKEWLKFSDIRPATLNIYILCDPASSKKKGSDKTAIPVVGIDSAGNKWLVDGWHHKMGLAERYKRIKDLRKLWMRMPGVQAVRVGYERYGSTSDLEHFQIEMQRDRDEFEIVELAWPREGPGSKIDRVQRLEPDFRNGRFYLPAKVEGETKAQARVKAEGQPFRVFSPVQRTDEEGRLYSLNKNFLEEFLTFPFCAHDDLIDAISRIYDIDAVPPIIIDERSLDPECFADGI
jgi:phage terminase large subunit-like protein